MTRVDERAAQRLLEQLGRLVVPLPSPDEESARLRRSAERVERLVSELQQQRNAARIRRHRWSVAAAAAVPVALVAGGFAWSHTRAEQDSARIRALVGAAYRTEAGAARAVGAAAGQMLHSGDALRTAEGAKLLVELADHARVDFAQATQVHFEHDDKLDERLELTRGSVSFEVPKLGRGHTLSVRTQDALVTVRGTRFSVSVVSGEGRPVTLVAVSEGRVQVDWARGTVFLTAGQQWSSAPGVDKATPVADASPVAAGASAVAAGPSAVAAAASTDRLATPSPNPTPSRAVGEPQRTAPSAALPERTSAPKLEAAASSAALTSTLGEENVLYERALRQAQSGETSAALADLESLMRRHPGSPLVQNARVEHFRILLRAGNRAAAAREARRYLSDYPDGFARSEAKNVALLSRDND